MSAPRVWLLWRVGVFLAALAPLVFWGWQVAINAAGPEPGNYLLLNIGIGGLWMLLLTLSLTPLTKLTRWKGFALIRRQLGLWTLAYATLHMLSYALFILGLNWALLGSEIVKRPYIIVGMIALIGLAVLGATSNKWSMRRLGKRWKSLHKFSYVILGTGTAALLLGGARRHARVGHVCRHCGVNYGNPPTASRPHTA